MKKNTAVTVCANDILSMDFAYIVKEDGTMSFDIELDNHSGISMILLRSAITCLGDYKITGKSEYTNEEDHDPYGNSTCHVVIHTDLPLEVFAPLDENLSIMKWENIKTFFSPMDISYLL